MVVATTGLRLQILFRYVHHQVLPVCGHSNNDMCEKELFAGVVFHEMFDENMTMLHF